MFLLCKVDLQKMDMGGEHSPLGLPSQQVSYTSSGSRNRSDSTTHHQQRSKREQRLTTASLSWMREEGVGQKTVNCHLQRGAWQVLEQVTTMLLAHCMISLISFNLYNIPKRKVYVSLEIGAQEG